MKTSILLVDDCRENLENFRELLELEGYTILTTMDPEKAYSISKNMLPELIVSDIKMNGMTGFELIQLIRLNIETCHIPFIFHSAHSEPSVIKLGKRMGASDFIVKPSCPSRLYRAINVALRQEIFVSTQMLNDDWKYVLF